MIINNDLIINDQLILNQFLINSKFINNSLKEKDVKDLTDKYNIAEIQNVKNWIELKKFANQIFSEIN